MWPESTLGAAMKTATVLSGFIFLAISGLLHAGDPVVGTWDWGGGEKVEVLPDGSISTDNNWTGHWTVLNPDTRTYSFRWDQSSTPNVLTLTSDNSRLLENNQGQVGIRGTRLGMATRRARELHLDGFDEFKAEQQAPVWCWAACIQMMLKQHGIAWNQKDIATAVKGRTHNIEAATADEITKALTGLRPTTPSGTTLPGETWSADCRFLSKFDDVDLENRITRSIAMQRPLIMSFRAGGGVQHVVLIYKVDYEPEPQAMEIRDVVRLNNRTVNTSFQTCKKLVSMTFYDPLTDETKTVNFDSVKRDIQGLWQGWVVKNDRAQRTFGTP
jgi:hypothetical protein